MNSGEIGTEAGRIFEYNLPSNWIFRSQEDQNDFGIDGEVELKNEIGKALGNDSVFKVQIKGEDHSSYINNGKTVSFKLKMEKLKYYFEFKVPVILVLVEVSSENIFWLPITNDEVLRIRVSELNDNESIQVHIPIENTLVRKNDELAEKMLSAVFDCWDCIHIQGLKESVSRYASISPKILEKNIEDIGNALFKAYHQVLNNSLMDKNFTEVYQKASEMLNSQIVPSEDRFIALLYYWQAFQIAPFTKVEKEIYAENNIVCDWLILLAKESKVEAHKLIAVGKCRTVIFKFYLKQLHATHHSVENFNKNSLEYFIFNNSTHELYRECSLTLQKIIDLSNRLSRNKQYDILTGLIIDIYPSFLLYKEIHKFRGSEESIEFLNKWQEDIELLVINYCVLIKDYFRIEILYLLLSRSLRKNSKATYKARKSILKSLPDFKESLDQMENYSLTFVENIDFYSLSIEEQKEHFIYRAKNLGMDPDDPESDYGRIVNIGLKNYDPTDIMKNCENLFVYYRPGGIIAQTLGMHSAGGMHLLVCSKHDYTQGTGNLLAMLYDNSGGPDLNCSFKQNYCNKCVDCIPRKQDWAWTIKWYINMLEKKKDFLK